MKRVLFTIQYRGTNYAGWQTQHNATGIQQVIEAVLSRLCGQTVRIEGAGRTDSGVHAAGQRAHADIPISIDERGLILGINDLLPRDIRIVDAQWVDDGFHARFDASGKSYIYRVWNAPVASVFHDETHAHVPSPLDISRMRETAKALLGTHDFRSFTVAEPEVSSTTRTIERLEIDGQPPVITLTVTADGFLRYMVRRIAGLLIEVGRGKLPTSVAAQAIEPNFGEARWTAPAHGLTLAEVHYDRRGGEGATPRRGLEEEAQ